MIRILRALVFALWAHRGQKDEAGKAYWRHLVTVAWIAYGLTHDVEAVVVGLLHDYLEDVNEHGWLELHRRFGDVVADCVQSLTRGRREDYDSYVMRIWHRGGGVVVAVKIADLLHNTDPTRCGTRNRASKYQRALQLLTRRRTGLSEPQ